jgi:hypothetical protein
MPNVIWADIGGALGGITVPTSGDLFRVPRDLDRMARDTLDSIARKPSTTYTWRSFSEENTNLELGQLAGFVNVSPEIAYPGRPVEAFTLLRFHTQVSVSGVGGQNGPSSAWLSLRMHRWHGAKPTWTAQHDFEFNSNGNFWITHVSPWDNSGGGDVNSGGIYSFQGLRSANWRCVFLRRQYDVFLTDRQPGTIGALGVSGLPESESGTVPQPSTYTQVGADGAVTLHVTDVDWLNATRPATYNTAGSDPGPVALGDGTVARFVNGTWEV